MYFLDEGGHRRQPALAAQGREQREIRPNGSLRVFAERAIHLAEVGLDLFGESGLPGWIGRRREIR